MEFTSIENMSRFLNIKFLAIFFFFFSFTLSPFLISSLNLSNFSLFLFLSLSLYSLSLFLTSFVLISCASATRTYFPKWKLLSLAHMSLSHSTCTTCSHMHTHQPCTCATHTHMWDTQPHVPCMHYTHTNGQPCISSTCMVTHIIMCPPCTPLGGHHMSLMHATTCPPCIAHVSSMYAHARIPMCLTKVYARGNYAR